MNWTTTLFAVLIMLLIAVPGYILKKTGAVGDNAMADFSKVLIYICQPMLMLYSFDQCKCSPSTLGFIGIGLGVILFLMLFMLFLFMLIYRRKYDNVRYRVANVATCFGNVAFFGIPVLNAVLPEHPEAVVLSGIFALVMNILGWTLASFIITKDKKYIGIKKVITNPAFLILIVIIPLFATGTQLCNSSNEFVGQLYNMIYIIAKMSTPLCMLILGMRLATVKIKDIFSDWLVYLSCFIKQVIFPLTAFALVYFLPIQTFVKQTVFILCCCPVASVVLNYSELIGAGQKTAANLVFLSTMSCAVTLPLMVMMIQFF